MPPPSTSGTKSGPLSGISSAASSAYSTASSAASYVASSAYSAAKTTASTAYSAAKTTVSIAGTAARATVPIARRGPYVYPGTGPIGCYHNGEGLKMMNEIAVHYEIGGGHDFIINTSVLDFSTTSQKVLDIHNPGDPPLTIGQVLNVDLFKTGINPLSLAFGVVEMIYKGSNQFSISPDRFDWDYQHGSSFKRNFLTYIGGAIFGRTFNTPTTLHGLRNCLLGGAFSIVFRGLVTIHP